MKTQTLRSDILLLFTSAIWGFAFVAQLKGMDFIGPYLYNGIRFLLGSVSLIPLILLLRKRASRIPSEKPLKGESLPLVPGLVAGTILFTGASLQQVGLQFTTAGKAGFITGLYVVIVPLMGLALRKNTGQATWIGAILAVFGLYFITITGRLQMGKGDLLVLVSSFFFAAHVLVIDNFAKKYNTLVLSSLQFAVCGILSLLVALQIEPIDLFAIHDALIPVLYGGLGSVGIAYTFQVVAQKNAPPSHSAIIMSLESVFAVLGGIIFLSEGMSLRGYLGCALMLSGMFTSQWDVIFRKAPRQT
jgi:drug/metabolite transporter (DMT)-like permease